MKRLFFIIYFLLATPQCLAGIVFDAAPDPDRIYITGVDAESMDSVVLADHDGGWGCFEDYVYSGSSPYKQYGVKNCQLSIGDGSTSTEFTLQNSALRFAPNMKYFVRANAKFNIINSMIYFDPQKNENVGKNVATVEHTMLNVLFVADDNDFLWQWYGTMDFENVIYATETPGSNNGSIVYNSIFPVSMKRMTWDQFGKVSFYTGGIWDDLLIDVINFSYFAYNKAILRDAQLEGDVYLFDNATENLLLRDSKNLDPDQVVYIASMNTAIIEQKSSNPKIVDKNNTPINGATIFVLDASGNNVTTSEINGITTAEDSDYDETDINFTSGHGLVIGDVIKMDGEFCYVAGVDAIGGVSVSLVRGYYGSPFFRSQRDSGTSVYRVNSAGIITGVNGKVSGASRWLESSVFYGTTEYQYKPVYTIQVQALGYKTKTISGITITEPWTPQSPIVLEPSQQYVIGKGNIQAQGSSNQWMPLGW